ncbi:hypothetical protein [uncultured Cohaesibacter sp.]|uniref:hypothetical protein n=1 Tax=uncultured Cohaesibacter sp. TaxID=1002546 RepID=UPI0029C6FBA5|nr:hypothetical protein [uncultured Cohaesibacter sp.]
MRSYARPRRFAMVQITIDAFAVLVVRRSRGDDRPGQLRSLSSLKPYACRGRLM